MNPEPTVYSRIINRELPAEILFENEQVIIIKTIKPHAPVHLLGITKKPFYNLDELLQSEDNKDLLWELLHQLAVLARKLGIAESGYKLVANSGPDSGQQIPHLHIHLMGGKKLEE